MKKFLIVLFVAIIAIYCQSVKAETIYYTNSKGVNFTEEQYNYIGKMFDEGYQEIISQDEFDIFKSTKFNIDNIQKTEILINDITRSSVTTTAKSLSLSKDGNIVSINLKWLKNPNVKSLDLIGFRLVDGNIRNIIGTYINSTNVSNQNNKLTAENYGQIVNISTISNGGYITLEFIVSGNGIVYGSYQHATKRTSYKVANSYNFASTGYGNVFGFYGDALQIYDKMSGVTMNF